MVALRKHLSLSFVVLVALLAVSSSVLAAALPGDLNNDGSVDAQDLAIFREAWEQAHAGQTNWNQAADLNGDQVLDYRDAELFLDDFLTNYTPSIAPADFLPLNQGDERLWVTPDGLYQGTEKITGTVTVGSATAYADDDLDAFGNLATGMLKGISGGQFVIYGLRVNLNSATTTAVKTSSANIGNLIFQPSLTWPAKLVVKAPVTLDADIYDGATNVGHVTMVIELLDMSLTVQTPAGSFSGCAEVSIDTTTTITGQSTTTSNILAYLAPGVGTVKEDLDPATPGTDVQLAQYATSGTKTYGTIPSATVAGLLPVATGNTWILGDNPGHNIDGGSITGTKTVGSSNATVLADFTLPTGQSAQYFLTANGSVSGQAGWREERGYGTDDFVMNPVFSWGTALTMGQGASQTGTVTAGSASYAYLAQLIPAAFDQSVDTPAGTFAHCTVVDRIIKWGSSSTSLTHSEADQRWWLAPGVGVVKTRNLVASTAQASDPYHTAWLDFADIGGTTHGTRPQIDIASALKLAQGNAARLQRQSDGTPLVRTVEGQTTISGAQAWPVTWLRGGPQLSGSGPQTSAKLETYYFTATASQFGIAGYAPDPMENQEVTRYVATSPASVPRTLQMGEVYVSPTVNIKDETTGQTIGQVSLTLSYTGRHEVSETAGDFLGCDVVDELAHFSGGGGDSVVEWYLDPTAGLVRLDRFDVGNPQNNEEYLAQWVRTGSQTYGTAGSFDIASYYPLLQGNKWRFNSGGSDGETATVGTKQNLGTYANVYPVVFQEYGSSNNSAYTDYWTDQTNSRLYVGFHPDQFPDTVLYQPAPIEPRPWELGYASRTAGTMIDPNNSGINDATVERLVIPIAGGLTVNTPAGTFTNCVTVFEMDYYHVPSQSVDDWNYDFDTYAPGLGPVDLWSLSSGDTQWWRIGSLTGAYVNGQWTGQQF